MSLFVTDSAEYTSSRGQIEYSIAANKQIGARAASLEYDRAAGRFTVYFGCYDLNGERNGSPMMFRVSVANKSRTFKTEAGAMKAITAHVSA
jgi:hypothetical protein